MKTIYSKNTHAGDKCCDLWHVRGLEYNYYATPRIHLMRVYGTCVIRLIHHYACECIIKELGASILGAIHHEQAGAGCWAVQNKVNCKGLYARKLDTLQTIVLITLIEQNNTRGGTTIPMLKMEKKHYMTLRRTISHFSPFYRWIVTWGASAILTPRQHNTTKKWNCPARLEFFEPTTNYDHHIWKVAEPNILSGGVVTVPWRTETSLLRFDHGWLSSARVCKFNMALIWH